MSRKVTVTCDDCGGPAPDHNFQMQWEVGTSTGVAMGPPVEYANLVFGRAFMRGGTRKSLDLCGRCYLTRVVRLGKLAAKTLKPEVPR